jgi:large subunit ribosomal protein L12
MEYVYAALILNESGEEINEDNLTDVLEAAGVSVDESRTKALVAALEDVDIDEAVEEAAPAAGGVPAPADGGAAAAPATDDSGSDDEDAGEPEADDADAGADDAGDDEDEEASGEGLGELFG